MRTSVSTSVGLDPGLERVEEEAACRQHPLAGCAAAHERGAQRLEHSGPVRARIRVRARAADRAPVADLGVTDAARSVAHDRVGGRQPGVLEDAAVRRAAADPPLPAVVGDPVEPAHRLDVHQQRRLREPELDQGQEAVAPGQDLCLPLAIRQDAQRFVQVARTDVLELAGDHALPTLLPARRVRNRCRARPLEWTDSALPVDDRGCDMAGGLPPGDTGSGETEVSARLRNTVNRDTPRFRLVDLHLGCGPRGHRAAPLACHLPATGVASVSAARAAQQALGTNASRWHRSEVSHRRGRTA